MIWGMKRALDIITGIAEMRRGVQKLGDALGAGKKQLEQPPKAVVKGESQDGGMTVKTHTVRNLDERVGFIVHMIQRGRDNPAVRKFTTAAVSKKCNDGWCVEEGDYEQEIRAVFDSIRENVRYVRDTHGKDLFQHPARTLEFRSADCLPEGTLIARRPYELVPIEHIQEGDEILGDGDWTRVQKTWVKGERTILGLELNNGSVLRCTPDHKLFCVPKGKDHEGAVEVRAGGVCVGDDLLQPASIPAGTEEIPRPKAFLLGAYVAEGWADKNLASISGIPESKGVRELAIGAADEMGIPVHEHPRYVTLKCREFAAWLHTAGSHAYNKRLPTIDLDRSTAETVIRAMEMGDGGRATSGSMVYSTISYELALQYRLLHRMLGRSTHIRRVDEHGGLGSHPIYRVTVRQYSADGSAVQSRRPWARVRAIRDAGEAHVYDLATDSGRIYLPECDVVVHNCDDYASLICACLQSIGYPVRLRVIRTQGAADWNHIYALVGLPPRGPTKWVPLDASIAKPAGWEAPPKMIADQRDFKVS